MRNLRYLPVAALAVFGACGSDSTSPTVDVNALLDQMAGGGIATYATTALSASVPGVTAAFSVPSSGTSSCAFSTATQRFDCAPVTFNGLTITRSYALLDASGNSLSTANPATITSIRTITDVKGTMTGTGSTASSMTIDRHEDATMSELRAATHVLNGTATQKLDFVATGLTYRSTEMSATANLKLPPPTAAVHWPLGGTITTDRTITVTGAPAAMTSHEVLAFDGTSIMTLTRTSGGVTMTCRFNLANPATAPVCT